MEREGDSGPVAVLRAAVLLAHDRASGGSVGLAREALRSAGGQGRGAVLSALEIAPASAKALEGELADLLASATERVERIKAAQALGQIDTVDEQWKGPDVRTGDDLDVALAVAFARTRRAGAPADVKLLEVGLASSTPATRMRAALLALLVGHKPTAATGCLRESLRSSTPALRVEATLGLGRVGRNAVALRPEIERAAADDRDWLAVQAARRALVTIPER